MATVTRLCVTKSVPTVNGRFPGPRLVVREGDRLVVQVHNNINSNVTFHWYMYILLLHMGHMYIYDPSGLCVTLA
jgi:FtsP/CotA-like multicopper oxidase with cupredoxin domain